MFRGDRVAGSWDALVRRLDGTDALGRWARQDGRLAGMHRVELDLVPLLAEGADRDRADEVLCALVGRAALDGGADDDALLLILHLLSDWILPLAREFRDLAPRMVGIIVGELTCQIRSYLWRTRTRAVAASLRWATRRAVLIEFNRSRSRRRYRFARVVDPACLQRGTTALGQAAMSLGEGEDIDLVDLLDWAAGHGVDPSDIALLVRTEVARSDTEHPKSSDVLAAESGLSRRTFFYRRARGVRALRAVSREYLAAVA